MKDEVLYVIEWLNKTEAGVRVDITCSPVEGYATLKSWTTQEKLRITYDLFEAYSTLTSRAIPNPNMDIGLYISYDSKERLIQNLTCVIRGELIDEILADLEDV